VFIVDNDPSARNGLTRLLRTAGHDGRGFASLSEFLDALGQKTSGCVVLDAAMLGLSGEKLRAEIKAHGVHLPIIVVTAKDDPETRQKARKMRAVGFFSKPVDGTALLDAIDWAMHLNSPSSRRETS